ncbi:MAG: 50S ribosomal protein L23 [candidate division Zixibacteria bacterium]|nr:50S ribosomal protein L23 [candidate division Zixibacteria bacterium]MDH3937970.1 50S ribosomal protein L23 [candidate division Zixibacteria bacterium]MDH4034239.1 50S ribosomal protein L23 [candidate division Zixibacteria bacterium]
MKADHRHVIKSHVATERSGILREKNNEYVFEVEREANKYQIKDAVESAFDVSVVGVRTMVVAGKPRRMGRNEGKTATWKKAVVRLKAGQSIGIFENI